MASTFSRSRSTPESIAAAEEGLALLDAGQALCPSISGPQPTEPFLDALRRIDPPRVEVRCKIGGHRLVVWTLFADRGAVIPAPRRGETQGRHLPPEMVWTSRTNAGRGPVGYMPSEGQGYHGTHDYHCNCGGSSRGRTVPVSAERRLQLYLQAVTDGNHRIEL